MFPLPFPPSPAAGPTMGEVISAELAALRASHPGWLIITFWSDAWADAAYPAGRRRLVAQAPRGGVIVSAFSAAGLSAKITRARG